MKTSYLLAHLLIQASLLTVALFVMPYFGFLITGSLWTPVGLLAAFSAARLIVFVVGQMLKQTGAAWWLISMILTATITVVALSVSGLVAFDAVSWWIVFFMLLGTFIFAHVILWTSGARPRNKPS